LRGMLRPSCPDLLIRALAEGRVAVIHGDSLQLRTFVGFVVYGAAMGVPIVALHLMGSLQP